MIKNYKQNHLKRYTTSPGKQLTLTFQPCVLLRCTQLNIQQVSVDISLVATIY